MPPYETLAIDRHDDGSVWIGFDVPGHRLNVLTAGVLEELAAALDEIEAGEPVSGLVLHSTRPGGFFAGADLDRLQRLLEASSAGDASAEATAITDAGRRLFGRCSAMPWPSLAIIDGICLGGGLELALGCDMRLASDRPETRLGLPEVKLGLLPAWGGTVRLPRLIGPGPAIELIASGEPVDADAAVRMGLVDACVPPESLIDSAAVLLARGRRDDLAARRSRLAAAVPLDPQEREFLEGVASAVILARTGGHYPAPPTIVETILAGIAVDAEHAAAIESRAFARLAASPQARELLHVFRLGEWNKRDSGVDAARDRRAGEPLEVATAGVVGGGIMGGGIAARHLRSGFDVALVDNSPAALARSLPAVLEEAAWDRTARGVDRSRALALAGRLRSGTQLELLADAEIVIESVLEKLDVKREVLARLEEVVAAQAVLASNTSTNPIARLAEPLQDPSRLCGMHFFNPVRRMMLVEVVRGPDTSDRTIATAVAHAKRLGKCPIVVRDSPGFLVNRILMPYLHEAVELVREGVPVTRIDRVARGFGMPMGPIELYDMIGLDTAFYAGLVMHEAFGERIEASPLIPALVKAGRLGRKSGSGFYRYVAGSGRPRGQDAEVAGLIEPYAVEPRSWSDDEIVDRLVVPMVLEAALALDERIVRDPRDIDLGVIHGLGFPPFRGGLLAWADSLGGDAILRRLEPFADLGPRMQAPDRLRTMAAAGGRFYPAG